MYPQGGQIQRRAELISVGERNVGRRRPDRDSNACRATALPPNLTYPGPTFRYLSRLIPYLPFRDRGVQNSRGKNRNAQTDLWATNYFRRLTSDPELQKEKWDPIEVALTKPHLSCREQIFLEESQLLPLQGSRSIQT